MNFFLYFFVILNAICTIKAKSYESLVSGFQTSSPVRTQTSSQFSAPLQPQLPPIRQNSIVYPTANEPESPQVYIYYYLILEFWLSVLEIVRSV